MAADSSGAGAYRSALVLRPGLVLKPGLVLIIRRWCLLLRALTHSTVGAQRLLSPAS